MDCHVKAALRLPHENEIGEISVAQLCSRFDSPPPFSPIRCTRQSLSPVMEETSGLVDEHSTDCQDGVERASTDCDAAVDVDVDVACLTPKASYAFSLLQKSMERNLESLYAEQTATENCRQCSDSPQSFKENESETLKALTSQSSVDIELACVKFNPVLTELLELVPEDSIFKSLNHVRFPGPSSRVSKKKINDVDNSQIVSGSRNSQENARKEEADPIDEYEAGRGRNLNFL
ncbi:hypothetical protein MPTK1_8g05780 [Marchantia polymorpha subsp. ruderalis]|uniref:Uncharacterized protein n=1 Tax=Marchantia polymorpha TaxID=3197 RepID=A0A2R6WKL6_MARPO|nr:hypothetical protein MARPO_0081s0080 [Marchantia polymorpha]BBN18823.1 hypothetical protein Mp_8g05780 [Marchantia polymorpha subsp. ruderalis]|eukprot:PTQ34363.1 hypothetical protein MARPO_0081s0080 [Marchantia polymorpha]